jgi:hypothetical protein
MEKEVEFKVAVIAAAELFSDTTIGDDTIDRRVSE